MPILKDPKWKIKGLVDTKVATNAANVTAASLQDELNLLAKQRCPYCDGYGHRAADCPTDTRINLLRQGVGAQRKILNDIRKSLRAGRNMGV